MCKTFNNQGVILLICEVHDQLIDWYLTPTVEIFQVYRGIGKYMYEY
jgi:hypothetical protein